jgi:hypothetical protein
VTIAEPAVEPGAENIGIGGLVQRVDLAGKVVKRSAVIELAFKGGELRGQANRCLAANREGELLGS